MLHIPSKRRIANTNAFVPSEIVFCDSPKPKCIASRVKTDFRLAVEKVILWEKESLGSGSVLDADDHRREGR